MSMFFGEDTEDEMPRIVFGWPEGELDECDFQIEAPTNEECLRCGEPIGGGERGFMWPIPDNLGHHTEPIHFGCVVVAVCGHDFDVCPCTGWDTSTKAAGDEIVRRMLSSVVKESADE